MQRYVIKTIYTIMYIYHIGMGFSVYVKWIEKCDVNFLKEEKSVNI